MSSKNRDRHDISAGASNPHKLVGMAIDLIGFFDLSRVKNEQSYQEIIRHRCKSLGWTFSVDRTGDIIYLPHGEIDSRTFKESGRWKADWYIRDYGIVIEVQGAQHKRPVSFGGRNDNAEEKFKRQQWIDREKANICKALGLGLVEIDAENTMKYKEHLRVQFVVDALLSAIGILRDEGENEEKPSGSDTNR